MTFASVLGGIRKVEGYPANIDNIDFNSTYHTFPNDSQGTFPSGYLTQTVMDITTVVYANNNRTQYVTCGDTSETHVRHYVGTTWSPWVRMDNFGCSTPSDLASLLGVMTKNKNILDFNSETTNGVYFSQRASASNSPSTNSEAFGILLVANFNNYGSIYQIFLDYKFVIYMRMYQNNTWSAWKSIALS